MLNGTLPSLNMGMSLGQQLGVRRQGTCNPPDVHDSLAVPLLAALRS